MKLKGKQLKRIRQYRSADPFKRKVARLRHVVNKKVKPRALKGLWVYFDMKKQMIQPLPATIDIDAWHNEFDAVALCEIFGVPYETYKSEQVNKSL